MKYKLCGSYVIDYIFNIVDIIKKIISDDKEDLYLPGNYIYKTAKNITLYLEYI